MSRIVAGRAGGRRLATPAHSRTRPTTDRVRESAFNLIGDWAGTSGEPADGMLERFSFLDLYAGSGAVALEAASRGAGPVVAVERDRATADLIRRNARDTGLAVEVVTAGVESYLAGTPRRFDVVWLDPPYEVTNGSVASHVEVLVDRGWLAADGLVVVERSSRDEPFAWPAALGSRRQRRYGETTLHLATKEP